MIKVTYDVSYKKMASFSQYHDEHNAIRDFNASNHYNICFEYANVRLAKNATQSLLTYTRSCRMPLKVMQRENTVIIEKRSKEEK